MAILIDWNSDLSVEINKIDDQHKKLISYLNELYNYMKMGKGKEIIEETLVNLAEYTKYHFNEEEILFNKFNYPDKAQHIKEHNAFIEKVKKFYDDFKNERLMLTIEIFQFLSDWVENHIKHTDKKYSSFFKDKEI